jgi:hypothetical protein
VKPEPFVAIDQAVAIEKQIADAKINHMAHEVVTIITPLGRMVKVRLETKGDDVWDTTIVYGKQIHRVGKFQGRDRAMEASKKKAVEVADVISANPAMWDEDDRKREKKYKKRKSVP